MDFSFITTLFSATAGGTIFGVVGGFLSKLLELRNQRQVAQIDLELARSRYAHEQAMAKIDNDSRSMEAEYLLKTAAVETTAAVQVAGYTALAENYKADTATYATGKKAKESGWFIAVDVVRGLTRPLLTWFLDLAVFGFAVALLWFLWSDLQHFPKDRASELLFKIVETMLFLASTGTSYWYASRPHAETGQRAPS